MGIDMATRVYARLLGIDWAAADALADDRAFYRGFQARLATEMVERLGGTLSRVVVTWGEEYQFRAKWMDERGNVCRKSVGVSGENPAKIAQSALKAYADWADADPRAGLSRIDRWAAIAEE